jgi:hypothetical protein
LAIKDADINTVELRELKALIADQQERLNALEAQQEAPAGDSKERRSTRRQLLKLAGATLMGAAGTAALKAVPASATSGDTMLVGTVRTQNLSGQTGISLTGTAAPGNVIHVDTFGSSATYQNAIQGWGQTGGDGIVGYGGKTSGSGVYGYNYSGSNQAIGTFGGTFSFYGGYGGLTGAGTGVVGYSAGGDGIHAHTVAQSRRALYAYTSATGSVGVAAYSQFGDGIRGISGNSAGVYAYSGTYSAFLGISFSYSYAALGVGAPTGAPDVKLGGSGRFVQTANISGGVGAPNYTPGGGTGFLGHGYFESIRADDGALWISRGTGTLKAAWKRVNAVRVDSSDGTGVPYAPYRVKDTRTGAKPAAGSTTVVQIAGLGGGASNIPADAIAVIGNLTATQYTGGGYLAISPAGVSVTTSTVNFITGQTAIANSFIVGLGTGANAGKVQVKVAGHASHFIIDVTGYFQ